MNSAKQTNKFTRFLRNNAALLLIIFCVIAIGTVVLVVALTKTPAVDDKPVVVNPNPDDDKDKPVVNPPDNEPTTTVVKVYFSAPVDYSSVTMDYTDGTKNLFVFNKTLKTWKTHVGVDLAAEEGTDVVAMYDGTVVEVSESYGMGNLVKIDHGNNIVATYASLGDVEVVKGQTVKKGDVIGVVSTSASYEFSDGAHLHLEVTDNGKVVDPTPYINGSIYREVEVKK